MFASRKIILLLLVAIMAIAAVNASRDNEYDLRCKDRNISCGNGQELEQNRKCCRYSNSCSNGWSQEKCLASNCCKSKGGDNGDNDDFQLRCKDQDIDCGSGQTLMKNRKCCRYSDKCGGNWSQKKCLASNCCEDKH
ncbi:hypothetical protein SARC_06285 [Sphaeroforma arctica JP610]|uniref:Uncharacterized protein n=1 Tax=Sphaeroforma arctica JP610 TaxID=667725 RepID=A0A0L0FZK5_9EUKA|nr:hypothetical protein SARC_06285 [Sphaeroforma arctica JP610]KNC81398.1 hypothetical protein SARC_06285 [Sphaeroforma arctica JP610]|eukprot:XP_014155300.1 hypothetical protein SARC_06285 [Sphaeroforma arctica JP610]